MSAELKPFPAKFAPIPVEGLKPGETKYFCTCGLSKNQPWCDGSHKETGMVPMKWTVPEGHSGTAYICQCKYSKNKPFCDGTHKTLKEPFEAGVKACKKDHSKVTKLCTACGFSPLTAGTSSQ